MSNIGRKRVIAWLAGSLALIVGSILYDVTLILHYRNLETGVIDLHRTIRPFEWEGWILMGFGACLILGFEAVDANRRAKVRKD